MSYLPFKIHKDARIFLGLGKIVKELNIPQKGRNH